MFGLHQARSLAALRPRDGLVLAEASIWLLATKACARWLPFNVWTDLVRRARLPEGAALAPIPWGTVRRVVWAVDVSSRNLPVDLACLPRALATRALLRRRRIPSALHVGVARGATQGLESHAWVECDNQVVIGSLPDLERYSPLVHFKDGQAHSPPAPRRAAEPSR